MNERSVGPVAVLGAGHGGHAIAAVLALRGVSVRLYDRYPAALEGARARGGVELTGQAGTGLGRPDVLTDDVRQAVAGARLIMVVTPAFAHRYIAEQLSSCVEEGQVVLLNTGATGSALEVYAVLRAAGAAERVLVGETETLLYTCRLQAPGSVAILAAKPQVLLAAMPSVQTSAVLDAVTPLFPQFEAASNVLQTSLGNINPIGHLPATLLNVARIESTRGQYSFWSEGMTQTPARLAEILDAERLAVAAALGARVQSFSTWMTRIYGVTGPDLASQIQANPAYATVQGPHSLDHRFITEDVPMGLVPMSELGRALGVVTPAMDTLINLAELLNQTSYRREGRNLARLELSGMNADAIRAYVATGRTH